MNSQQEQNRDVAGEASIKRVSRDAASRIRWLGITTCNRPAQVRRCLISYVHHLRRFGREYEIAIVDDTASSVEREASRKWYKEFGRRHHVSVSYAGNEEKTAFIDRMIRAGIPGDELSIALRNSSLLPESPGTNRNALLLQTVGALALSCDDDSICRPRMLCDEPLPKGVSSYGNADMDVHFARDPLSALQSRPAAEFDLMSAHEELLGLDLAQCISADRDHLGSYAKLIGANTVTDLVHKRGRVGITLSGILGDPGMPDLMGFMLARGDVRRRFLQYWTDRVQLDTISVVSGVSRPIVSFKSSIMTTTATGFDHRTMLPPFVPFGRGEDTLFGTIVNKCNPELYTGFIPVALLHARRKVKIPRRLTYTLGLGDILAAIIGGSADAIDSTSTGRMRRLANHLLECAYAPGADFARYLHTNALRRIVSQAEHCKRTLRDFNSEPDFWAHDLRLWLNDLESKMDDNTIGLPAGVGERVWTCEEVQTIVRKLGLLLRVWPDIISATTSLKQSGAGVAQLL